MIEGLSGGEEKGWIYAFVDRRLGDCPGGLEIFNANVAHNHSPLQAKVFEKRHILLVKEDIFVIIIE